MSRSLQICQLLTLLSLLIIAHQASGQLMRIAEPNSTICPGERVQYSCHAEEIGEITTLQWSIGNILLSPQFIRLRDVINATEGETQSNPQLPGVIANLTEVTGTGFTSILTIDSAGVSVANQTVIQCSGTGFGDTLVLTITSDTAILDIEASEGSGLEVSSVTLTVQLCTVASICIDVPDASITDNCQLCTNSPCTNFLPQTLNLCQSNYTIIAYTLDNANDVQASTVVAAGSSGSALNDVTDTRSTSTSLFWSPPGNSPDDCITGYEISWDGGSFIHYPSNDSMPSVTFDVLKENRFPICEAVDVTISPFLPAVGVLDEKAANYSGLIVPGTLGLPGLGYDGAIAISVILPSLFTLILGIVIGIAISFCFPGRRHYVSDIQGGKSKDGEQEQSMI